MLRIAVVANTFVQAKRFAEFKFRNQIAEFRATVSVYTLTNGDMVYLCYDEQGRDKYLSVEFDALVIEPQYQSLLDVIRRRCERG